MAPDTVPKSAPSGGQATTVLQFTVSDTGIGMTAEQQTKLFSPYYQCESGIGREQGGTGLGLSIVDGLVEVMGGSVSVASEYRKGTCFTCVIPFEADAAISDEEQPEDGPPRQNMDWRGRACLLVDDTPLNVLVLQRQLEKRGCLVLTATNGHECIDVWCREGHRLDIILMDIWMPVLDGLEATRELRSRGASQPIIGLTADVTHTVAEQGRCAGMTAVLVKPVAWDQLERVIVENTFSQHC
uniref:histidine kinase n=1 Tax=Eutreptiella gymnastica TaxID=73025 RepID=A0A7S1N253_9EUGL|mmetsp:Transcript_108183/g.186759  ORF Transcript_108183/g.186759 Transcript_108183/m.186759 type:complete len:242 (+) Transcript_108183:86-811(+)